VSNKLLYLRALGIEFKSRSANKEGRTFLDLTTRHALYAALHFVVFWVGHGSVVCMYFHLQHRTKVCFTECASNLLESNLPSQSPYEPVFRIPLRLDEETISNCKTVTSF